MYEDFSYIADGNLLERYWSEEKVTCPNCQGTGKLIFNIMQDKYSVCPVCHGSGLIQRQDQQKLVKYP